MKMELSLADALLLKRGAQHMESKARSEGNVESADVWHGVVKRIDEEIKRVWEFDDEMLSRW